MIMLKTTLAFSIPIYMVNNGDGNAAAGGTQELKVDTEYVRYLQARLACATACYVYAILMAGTTCTFTIDVENDWIINLMSRLPLHEMVCYPTLVY